MQFGTPLGISNTSAPPVRWKEDEIALFHCSRTPSFPDRVWGMTRRCLSLGQPGAIPDRLVGLDRHHLVDAALVAATFKRRSQEKGHDLFGQTQADHPGTYRQDVGVVVLAGHAR